MGEIEIMDDMNISIKTMSKATPQLSGTLPETVNTVVIMKPIRPVRLKVAGNGSIVKLLFAGL